MPGTHSYVSGSFFLDIGTTPCGFVSKVEGGGISAEVLQGKIGFDHFASKHVGRVHYEDVTVEAGLGMAEPFWKWIVDTCEHKCERHDVSIIACDYQLKAQNTRLFAAAALTEITVPAMDAASKEPVRFKLKFLPEQTRSVEGDGKALPPSVKPPHAAACSNFRLEIPGLDCTKVVKIDTFTVKQKVSVDEVGERRDAELVPGGLEFPDLKITFSASTAKSWEEWFKKFVNESGMEPKSGVLTLLAPNMKDEIMKIELAGLGIFRLTDDWQNTERAQVHRKTAELFCEQMKFHPPKAK